MISPPTRSIKAQPFLKWAGGKRQLLAQIDHFLPQSLKNGTITRYVEPFIGSGAVFLHIVQNYPLKELFIADLNPELILAYRTIQKEVEALIAALQGFESSYLPLKDAQRKKFYYEQRARFNANRPQINFQSFQGSWINRTAQLIFLNRTCYNGLFRVNNRGGFNVPFGRYANPTICDARNLQAVANILQNTSIRFGRYDECAAVVDDHTFVYFDPPYRPISPTARFTAYSQHNFADPEQLDLAAFYRHLDARGTLLMLSNSDPQNINPGDDFFEVAYAGYRIEKVLARRRINSRAENRGPIFELLIMNYDDE